MASNTFVHKHYEKVILAVLLLLFSGLLYLQLSVVQKSQGKKVELVSYSTSMVLAFAGTVK